MLGGGSGGMACLSHLLSNYYTSLTHSIKFGDSEESNSSNGNNFTAPLALIEPSANHYYQPLWTLVGGGLKKLDESVRSTQSVLDNMLKANNLENTNDFSIVDWHEQSAKSILPDSNCVILSDGTEISYDYLIISTGIKPNLGAIEGLEDALKSDTVPVCSNYLEWSVEKTDKLISNFKGGKALFTQPTGAIKCAGAPQKIAYLAQEKWQKKFKKNDESSFEIDFVTGMPKLFAVEKYERSLLAICNERDIAVTCSMNLVKIDNAKRKAYFKSTSNDKSESKNHKFIQGAEFDFLHVSPPMKTPECLAMNSTKLVNSSGFVDVDKNSLQSTAYPNVFSLGDCSNVPVSKTASAVAAQCGVLSRNLALNIQEDALKSSNISGNDKASKSKVLKETFGIRSSEHLFEVSAYDGYTSCPLVTSSSSLILAEFNGFNLQPRETFWFNQSKERLSMSVLNSEVLPQIYFDMMLLGRWEGPARFRRILNPLNRD